MFSLPKVHRQWSSVVINDHKARLSSTIQNGLACAKEPKSIKWKEPKRSHIPTVVTFLTACLFNITFFFSFSNFYFSQFIASCASRVDCKSEQVCADTWLWLDTYIYFVRVLCTRGQCHWATPRSRVECEKKRIIWNSPVTGANAYLL